MPARHVLQFTARPSLKVPASQLMQALAPLSDPVADPAVQSSHAPWPEALWNRPLEHSLQLVEPVVAATFPASHAVQLKLLLEAE